MIDLTVTQKRMLVAVETPEDEALLELAVSLARQQSAELSALFVEDINLFLIAGLPFAQEIDRVTAVAFQIDSIQISRQIDRKVQRLRQRLMDLEKQSQLSVSLKVVRGQYFPEVLAAASEMDLLLFAKKTAGRSPAKNQKRLKSSFADPVWVIFNGSREAEYALTLADSIARNRKAKLNIILDIQRVQDVKALKQQVAGLGLDQSIIGGFFVNTSQDCKGILTFINQRGCSIIVMHAEPQEAFINSKAERLSELTGCPVLLAN